MFLCIDKYRVRINVFKRLNIAKFGSILWYDENIRIKRYLRFI